jgi:hypothetical protein
VLGPMPWRCVAHFRLTMFGASSTRCWRHDLHAKRVKPLPGATLGAIQSASLAVGLIGQGLPLARGRLTKHVVKQVDRLLSNHRSRCRAGPLGTLRGRQTRQHHGGDGLDRVRRRRPGDDHAVSVVPPRTGHAAGLADRGQGGAEKPSQRLRVSGSWCAWPKCCPPMSVCASWPIAASATTSSTGC